MHAHMRLNSEISMGGHNDSIKAHSPVCVQHGVNCGSRHLTVPKLMYTAEAEAAVNRIMVALVAAATSGSTPISSIRGPCAQVWRCKSAPRRLDPAQLQHDRCDPLCDGSTAMGSQCRIHHFVLVLHGNCREMGSSKHSCTCMHDSSQLSLDNMRNRTQIPRRSCDSRATFTMPPPTPNMPATRPAREHTAGYTTVFLRVQATYIHTESMKPSCRTGAKRIVLSGPANYLN